MYCVLNSYMHLSLMIKAVVVIKEDSCLLLMNADDLPICSGGVTLFSHHFLRQQMEVLLDLCNKGNEVICLRPKRPQVLHTNPSEQQTNTRALHKDCSNTTRSGPREMYNMKNIDPVTVDLSWCDLGLL